MQNLFSNPILWVTLTLLSFYIAQQVYQKWKWAILNPVLLSITALIAILWIFNVDYSVYNEGGRWISFLLGPAVVALGVPLYQQLQTIRKKGKSILVSIGVGSLVGILCASGSAALVGASKVIILSIAPRSVTTPIAIGISEKIGGIPSLTAAFVVATGVLGAVIGPLILNLAKIKSRSARGLALGAASHGIGTARALEEGELEGASAGLAICLMGIATALFTPFLTKWIVSLI